MRGQPLRIALITWRRMFGYLALEKTSRCTVFGRVQVVLGGGVVGAGATVPLGPAHGQGSDSQFISTLIPHPPA